ncbi:MAG: hypothetical protein QOG69_2437 [Actinomycetota bacterium]|nr:hypothetical protein [Actinomycetota bacterium]
MSTSVVSPIFVGRTEELSKLGTAVERAASGQPGFALIGGEAGVGKTRFVEELASRATEAGFLVLVGRCVEIGAEGLPLAPLVDALRALARERSPEDLAELLGPARRGLSRLLPELDPSSAADSYESDGGRTAQLLELVLGLVGRLSVERPLMLVLEDLHWADQSTLELVAFLVRVLRGERVLLVATYRSDELHRRHPLLPLVAGWDRVRSVDRVELRRFDRSEVAAQLEAILADSARGDLVDTVFDRSGGNAFLVEELVGVVRDGGDPADLPASLRHVLLTRMDSLGETAQRLVRIAAVGGRRVTDQLLATVARLDEAALFPALREVTESNLLVVDDTGRGFEFRHALARDAIYEAMLPGERVRLHAEYGEALSSLVDGSASPAVLAHHWYAALDLPRALAASIDAAQHATSAYSPVEAQRHLERVLEIWPRVPDAEERAGIDLVEVTRRAGSAAYVAGEVDRALALFDQAMAERPPDFDNVRQALLLDHRARVLIVIGRVADTVATLDAAMALLPTDHTTRAHAVVLSSVARASMWAGDMATAAQTATRALDASRAVGDAEHEVDALITLGTGQAYLGDTDAGVETLRAAVALGHEHDLPEMTLRAYTNLSDVLEMLGLHADAAEAAGAGIALAKRVGLSRTVNSFLVANLAEPLLRMGRWSEIPPLLEEALSTQPEGAYAAALLSLQGELAVLTGRYADAAADMRATRRVVGGGRDDPQFVASIAYIEAAAAYGLGDLPAARDIIERTVRADVNRLEARYGWPLLRLGMRLTADLAERARDRRDPSSAPGPESLDRTAASLEVIGEHDRAHRAVFMAERVRFEVAGGTPNGAAGGSEAGDGVEVAAWSTAVASCRTAADEALTAYALFRLAAALCVVNDKAAATPALQEAFAISSHIGAKPIIDEASALARRARLPLAETTTEVDEARANGSDDAPLDTQVAAQAVAPRDELARFGLTDREREVLKLLLLGRSNPQIAKELFISPKTASVHVSNILAKLGVSGRMEAAALAHRLGVGDTAS